MKLLGSKRKNHIAIVLTDITVVIRFMVIGNDHVLLSVKETIKS